LLTQKGKIWNLIREEKVVDFLAVLSHLKKKTTYDIIYIWNHLV